MVKLEWLQHQEKTSFLRLCTQIARNTRGKNDKGKFAADSKLRAKSLQNVSKHVFSRLTCAKRTGTIMIR
jgi:hypothetical protein